MTTPSLPSPTAEIEPEAVRLDVTLTDPNARALLYFLQRLPLQHIDQIARDTDEALAMLDAASALIEALAAAGYPPEQTVLPDDTDEQWRSGA